MSAELTKEIFNRELRNADSICILGHISPDGDCMGSVLGVYNYILNLRAAKTAQTDGAQSEGGRPQLIVRPYLEEVGEKFRYLPGSGDVCTDHRDEMRYQLAVVCDCADADRTGKFRKFMDHAERCVMIDHHITNPGFGDYCLVKPHSSSASEVLYGLLEEEYIDYKVAECIYTGLIHDTGVFRHNSTSPETMRVAAKCMEYGINFNRIIEESFFSMTFEQKRMLGWLLCHMESRLDGRLILSCLDMKTRREMGAEDMDMDGMIDQLRTTTGALLAAYMYETKDGRVKLSLRSNSDLADVSRIAQQYGGGGHKRAAGCFMGLDFAKNAAEIEALVKEQLEDEQ